MEGLANLGISGWNILIYLVNTGLLLVVLIYLLYKPILRFIDKRRSQIEESVAEARLLKEELDKKSREAEAAEAKMEATLKKEMENLRKFTEEKRAELTAEMERARAEMMEKAEADIDRKKRELLKEAEAQTLTLMKKIILDVVQNKVPEKVVQESIHEAWTQYKK